jgi:hypothetical protein
MVGRSRPGSGATVSFRTLLAGLTFLQQTGPPINMPCCANPGVAGRLKPDSFFQRLRVFMG